MSLICAPNAISSRRNSINGYEINDAFLKVVKSIKALITPSVEDVAVEDIDAIIAKVSAPYDSLLRFLWAKRLPAKLTNTSNNKTQTYNKSSH